MADHPGSGGEEDGPLLISPTELIFPPPLNRVITNVLKLSNTVATPLAYKVKTTAPKRYCVRPNAGIISPGETIEVQVLFNYMKDKPSNLKAKDKFQIQTITVDPNLAQSTELKDLWASAKEEDIKKQRIKGYFQPRPGSPVASAPMFSPTIQAADISTDSVSSVRSRVRGGEDFSEALDGDELARDEELRKVRAENKLLASQLAQANEERERLHKELQRTKADADAVSARLSRSQDSPMSGGPFPVRSRKPAEPSTSASTPPSPAAGASRPTKFGQKMLSYKLLQLLIVAIVCLFIGKYF
eukprot:TRINITY_DN2127_c0_g1_i2.p1 TRINITY_DN2127_c0_g1~~TRINITY_DN2127_c0_g1_i2.p1  ORF type:complete len:301 (-),score=65.38 TRINITY_DN2127_c0_g1_i2:9-911(-)